MVYHFHSAPGPDDDGPDPKDAMREMLGPGAVDQQSRQAISTCWMMLPVKGRTPEAVAREIRRLVDRALTNLADDAGAFGFGAEGPPPPT